MQKYHVEMMRKGEWQGDQAVYCDDEVDAEIQRLKGLLNVEYGPMQPPQPPVMLPEPPSHETSYANNLTAALESCRFYENAAERLTKERDTLRDVLRLLAPDLKTMAILYAQQGDHQRSQALANICKSVGVK
jgi:hypothetical protein